jgi:Arc/MetJ-type ribon-helix-helix transcriptional regulator
MPASAKPDLQTTTVRLPRQLYEEARGMVVTGAANASSLNQLLVDSLDQKLKQLRRSRIDAEFAGMRTDAQFHRESKLIAEQFSANDRVTLRSPRKGKP